MITLNASANNDLTLQQIKTGVEAHIRQQLPVIESGQYRVQAVTLDPRIRAYPCPEGYQYTHPAYAPETRQLNVKVACTSRPGWQLYVPTRIRTLVPVIVASRTLPKDTLITRGDLKTTLKDSLLLRDRSLEAVDFIGAKSKRRISAGQVLSPHQVCLVCKGEKVTIVAKYKGLSVRAAGRALGNATKGSWVLVKNRKTGKELEAKVTAAGKVEIEI